MRPAPPLRPFQPEDDEARAALAWMAQTASQYGQLAARCEALIETVRGQ